MNRSKSAWAVAHAPAGTRWGRRTLALLLSLVLCLTLLPTAALAADEDTGSAAVSYGLWLEGKEITSENAGSYFEYEGDTVIHYTLTNKDDPQAGGTLYIEKGVWFTGDHTESGISATIYAKYPLTIRLNGGLTVSTYNESAPAEKVGTGNIYCEDTLTVQGSIQTVGNQDYDLFVLGSVSAKSVTLEYAHLRSNAGSVTARDGDITLTGNCLKAANGAYTDGTCVSAANGAIIAKNAETRNSTECYKNGEQQTDFVSGETNCLKNTTLVAELDNRPEQVETPIITPYNTIDGVTFIGTQEIYLFCNTDGAAIHYTLDGTKPTKDSTQYSGPFTIDKNCVIKAIAVKEGMADSDVVTRGNFIKVTGIDEPSIRFSPDGKAYPANDTISFGDFSKEYEYVLVPNYGAADDYANVSVSGKVAVVQRGGNITFADKYKNAKAKGAAGLIIYNNQSGKVVASLGDMSEGEKTIPLIGTTQEAGLAALHNTKDNIYGTLQIDPQQPGFKIKVCNVRYLTGEKHLLTGRVRFTALCGEGDFVTMDQDIVLDYEYTGFLPSDYWDNFDHWSCNDPNVSLTETPDGVDSPAAYDRLITIPDHDIQLIANWKDEELPAPHYEITFDLNYEGAPNAAEAVTGTDGKLAALLHDPVRSGYLFEGWYTAAEGGEEVTVDRVYTQSTILYAHWTADDGSIAINRRNFPDDAFRTFVADYDTDKNGRLSTAELEAVTTMECRDLGIADLTGIAYFTALEELTCTGNRLTELDVSRNRALQKLYCGKNQLTSLNVNGSTALEKLFCFKNRLTALDVSKNTELNTLNCSRNQLTSLNLSANTKLTDLDTEDNAYEIQPNANGTFDLSTLPRFDVNKASDWTGGSVSDSTLTVDKDAALVTYTYDVGKTVAGKSTVAFTLMIKDADTGIAIDAAHFPDAAFRAYLSDPDSNIDRNQDSVLSAGEIALVREITIDEDKKLTDLTGIGYFTALEELDCSDCRLTSLDVSQNTKLTRLDAERNTYEIQPGDDGNFDLSTLPGKFDESKAGEWNGGTVKDGILTVKKDAEEVTYLYDCGKDYSVTFTLKIAKKYTVTAYGLYGGTMGIKPGEAYTAKYAEGEPVGLQIGKRDGYTLESLTLEGITENKLTWQAKGHEVETRGISFTMPANNVTITVNWAKNGSSSGGGGGGSSSASSTYPVIVTGKIENGSVTVSPKNAGKGDTVTITVTPDEGYTLETLTVTDKNGNKLTLQDKGSGKYTFTQPSGKVTVTATFMDDNTMLNYFVDVQASDYYYDAVLWAAQKGITSGTDAAHFSPNQPCTRAQIVTFLWRTAGSPVVNYAMNMSDVPEDAYYAEAVRWALSEGITGGVGDGRFDPNATCTREQAVTFLHRVSGSPAVSDGNAFSDVAANAYYADAVAWAEKNGVTGGIGGGLFGSGRDCTRAQIVTFLYRAYQGK